MKNLNRSKDLNLFINLIINQPSIKETSYNNNDKVKFSRNIYISIKSVFSDSRYSWVCVYPNVCSDSKSLTLT